jgi:amidophosphoribosyltransferase
VAAVCHLAHRSVSPLVPDRDLNAVPTLIPRMLLDIQNRGQLAAGITSFNRERRQCLRTYKQLGTVQEAFHVNQREQFSTLMASHAGSAAIGHVRYATLGDDDNESSQPLERKHSRLWKWFSFAFNGQLANYLDLKREFLASDHHLMRDSDSELLLHEISKALSGDAEPSMRELFAALAQRLQGAWNVVFVNAKGDMAVARDPVGFRPLSWAFDGSLFAAASEDVALENMGFRQTYTLKPGELVYMQPDRPPQVVKYAESKRRAHCVLEWVYFSNVASTLDGSSVYSSRAALGEELAKVELARGRVPLDEGTIVVPVPETAKPAGDAMAYRLKLRSMEGIVRNRYVGRTFIQGSGNRSERAKRKYTPIRKVLEGKRVLLVEDTIVRATTMQVLLRELRERGKAKEIHVRVACPPILGPCFYGLDISTVSELFVPSILGQVVCDEKGEQKLADALGVDSLHFLPQSSLSRAIGIGETELCMACIDGRHPTDAGARLYAEAVENARERFSEYDSSYELARASDEHMSPFDGRELVTVADGLERGPEPKPPSSVGAAPQ